MTYRAFVSSTFEDLKDHRAHVVRDLRRSGFSVDPMEDWTAASDEPKQFSQERVAGCNLCVLLVGLRRGHVPEGETLSITQREHRAACERRMDVLVFLLDKQAPWPRKFDELDKDPEIRRWREHLAEHYGVEFFSLEPSSIAIAPALARWLAEHGQQVPGILPSLLIAEKFTGRAEQTALFSHKGMLVGREQVLDQIASHLGGPSRIIILHSSGGIGKTRLLLALPKVIPEDNRLLYARTEAESIEPNLATLDHNRKYIIVVDDAHRYAPLPHLVEVLINPDFAGKVKLVLATRSVFSKSIAFHFPQIRGDQIAEIRINPLTNADIDHLLQNPPCDITVDGIRRALIVVAEGNPLIAHAAARLVQRGANVTGLTRDEVLTHYLDGLVHDLADVGYGDRYVTYLEVLAALGTLELDNEALRERVQQVVGLSQVEEERIVARLVEAGLVERYWMTLKIASEVLADHILISHFFDPQTRRADFQTQIVAPFFDLRPKEILTNLAEAEVKGESPEAGLLLGRKLDGLHRVIDSESNIVRLDVLDWMEDVAYLRPYEAMAIVARIVDGPVLSPETHTGLHWDLYAIDHEMVLSKAVDVLSHTIYRGVLRDAITYLHKIVRYGPETTKYESVREKARRALIEIAQFKMRKPFTVQLTLLPLLNDWLTQEFADNLDLVLSLTTPMLSMQFVGIETDPTEPFKVTLHRGVLGAVEPLRRIREQALAVLYEAYQQASTVSQRLRIVQAFDGAAPHAIPVSIPDETQEWLQPGCVNTAHFLSEVVVPIAELPVLNAVSRWLWRVRRSGRYDSEELARLAAQLQAHGLYQLYRMVIGWRWEEEDEQLDWKRSQQRRQEAIELYLNSLSAETFDQVIDNLTAVVAQARDVGETSTSWLNQLLAKLGEQFPDLACQLVEHSLREHSALKHHLSCVIAGLRRSAPRMAMAYVEAWIAESDSILWLAVAHSYRFVDWETLGVCEWSILRQLVMHNHESVDDEIIWLTWQFAPHKTDLAVELLTTMAARGDEHILREIARVLGHPNEARDGWAVQFSDSQGFLDIVRNLERLPMVDSHIEGCLDRMGQIAPMQLIEFMERRIHAIPERRVADERYDALPYQFSRAVDSIRSSPQYLNVLRRVRDWMLWDNPSFRLEAPRVLKEITGGLSEPLYCVFMEWVSSDDDQKLKAVANALREFNIGGPFYSLSREIIHHTDDEAVLGMIVSAIHSTPGIISGDMSNFSSQRLEEVSPWLEDEDPRVRRFAHRIVSSLQRTIEHEQAREELERRTW